MEIARALRVVDLLKKEAGNMTLLQTQILLAVMDAEGSSELTQPELAKRFETTVASVSRSIDKLALGTVLDPTTKAYRIGPELLSKSLRARRILEPKRCVYLSAAGSCGGSWRTSGKEVLNDYPR